MESKEPSQEKHLPRRNFLKIGAYALGAIVGVTAIGVAANEVRKVETSYETSYERSSEFSKTPDWQQNFAESATETLDTTIWHYETSPNIPSYNNEVQGYTDWRQNVRIEEGIGLVIEAHKRDYQYPNDPEGRQFEYTSGRIDTRKSLSFEYGKVEATMKLPEGEGVWPAFWLLSGNEVHTLDKEFSQKEENDQDFYLRNGEIDIMEYYGNNPSQVELTVHTYNGSQTNSVNIENATREFHTYGAELTPDNLILTIDGKPYHTFAKSSDDPNDWPFGNYNQMYIILNLAMGGPAGEINDKEGPWRLEVADISFYNYTGDRP